VRRVGTRALLPVVAVALLALPACDIFDLGAIRAEQWVAGSPAVAIHDGGNIGDQCVFDAIVTGGTAVALAAAPPAGAIATLLSWSIAGVGLNATAEACFDSWRNTVDPSLKQRDLEAYCAAGSIALYDDCLMKGWAEWEKKQAMRDELGDVIAAGAYLGWCQIRFGNWACHW